MKLDFDRSWFVFGLDSKVKAKAGKIIQQDQSSSIILDEVSGFFPCIFEACFQFLGELYLKYFLSFYH